MEIKIGKDKVLQNANGDPPIVLQYMSIAPAHMQHFIEDTTIKTKKCSSRFSKIEKLPGHTKEDWILIDKIDN